MAGLDGWVSQRVTKFCRILAPEINPRMSGIPLVRAEKLRIDALFKAVFRKIVDSKASNCDSTLPSQFCRLNVKYHARDTGLWSSLAAGLVDGG
jgi:hypothetical protein